MFCVSEVCECERSPALEKTRNIRSNTYADVGQLQLTRINNHFLCLILYRSNYCILLKAIEYDFYKGPVSLSLTQPYGKELALKHSVGCKADNFLVFCLCACVHCHLSHNKQKWQHFCFLLSLRQN